MYHPDSRHSLLVVCTRTRRSCQRTLSTHAQGTTLDSREAPSSVELDSQSTRSADRCRGGRDSQGGGAAARHGQRHALAADLRPEPRERVDRAVGDAVLARHPNAWCASQRAVQLLARGSQCSTADLGTAAADRGRQAGRQLATCVVFVVHGDGSDDDGS